MHRELVFIRKKEQLFPEDLNNLHSKSLILSGNLGSNFLSFPFFGLVSYDVFVFSVPIIHTKRAVISSLIKIIKLFLRGLMQGFFLEFRIIGLGFRVKRSGFLQTRSLKFDIGFSHIIRISLPQRIKLGRVKRRFFVFSNDFTSMHIFSKNIKEFKILNPYKLRGLKASNDKTRMKPGKKQNKR